MNKRRVPMALVLVCPQCQAKVLLQSQNCPYCQADLRDVPQDRRRYALGQPGPSTPRSAPEPAPVAVLEPAPEPILKPEAAKQEVRIRRPHVRRYAAPPVSVTHPVIAKSPETAVPPAAESKPAAKKAKKTPAGKKKK
jgi:hypothetical protein